MKILVTEQQIQDSINKVAEEIHAHESGKQLTVIAIMTGSIVFLADLMRKLDLPMRVGVVQTSSYKGGTTRGTLTINPTIPARRARSARRPALRSASRTSRWTATH